MGPRLILGTAAFGSEYGIKGDGQPSKAKAERILRVARLAGIDMVDTAPSYGHDLDLRKFKVVTKTPWDGEECYAVLVHDPDDTKELVQLLIDADTKVGISVYTPEQMERALEYPIDVIQFPLNIVDTRFLPYLEECRERGIETHARSVFLQGALLIGAQGAPRLSVETCLGYVLAQDVDRVVVGVHTPAQLRQILKVQPLDIDPTPIADLDVIDPRRWGA